MSEAVAKRYAQALFEIAKEHGQVDSYEAQLKMVKETIAASKELRQVLNHPQIDKKDKKALIEKLFHSDTSTEMLNLLYVLVDRSRENIIPYLYLDFVDFANDDRGIVDMIVTTATPMDEEEQRKFTEELAAKLQKKLRLTIKVDKDIIGGMIVKVGNRVFDSSIAGKLQRFKRELNTGR
ncbi:ATP synthase F1 subcomplex delta subunit [Scopulibacillus darangshiensis]|uniref:ATP synthase subunit delta n=1 Tax=Scopulibacillus darangshiensis TaxID=442528 RepID=A0A4R2NG37_9BACL|nr:F0F1 ATP synthase subunit delta [Scopulibacillus darangshiensis]TCP20257.1 ATP synthase F1 subcomplex delta subunit [Scopulibacillus darangshiensis]